VVIVLRRHDQLDLDTYWRVASGHEPLTIDPALLDHVEERRRAMEAHLAAGATAYGVTTGLGHFADREVAAADQLALQRAIVVGRAAGIGPPYDEAIVRGTMLLRLTGFLAGHTGVTAVLCTYIAERLNTGWFPVVPASRPGTAGETISLCHLFQTFLGEGEVLVDGERRPASAGLADDGAAPYELLLKEGLALINGAPLAAALGAEALRRCEALLEHATLIGALTTALMGASWRPYSRRVAAAKGDPGQHVVTARLAALATGGDAASNGKQAPVSLRVLPQVHGAAHDVVTLLRSHVDRELRAVTDSPLFLDAADDEPAGFYPTGNFHSQGLSLALDAAAIAMAQVGALSEKRLHRLLDGRFSGLPDQLAADASRGGSGLVSLHKSVVGLCAENRLLANPASIHSADTSAGQEDFQAFTGLAASKLAALLDNVELTLANELVADRQARALGGRAVPPRLERTLAVLAERLPPVTADRSLAPLVEETRTLLRSGRLRCDDQGANTR
jgi:histidine ammonia-lyase